MSNVILALNQPCRHGKKKIALQRGKETIQTFTSTMYEGRFVLCFFRNTVESRIPGHLSLNLHCKRKK